MSNTGYSTYKPRGDDHYSTGDTALAAALKAAGHPIVDVVKKTEKTAHIVFLNCDQLQEDIIAFSNNNLFVDAASMWDAIRQLRSRCKSVTGTF